MDKKKILTIHQAYRALFHFLSVQWQQSKATYPDTLPGLLGSMQLLTDGIPADAGMFDNWQELWGNHETRTTKEGFQLGKQFVMRFAFDDELSELLTNWNSIQNQQLWDVSVEYILNARGV